MHPPLPGPVHPLSYRNGGKCERTFTPRGVPWSRTLRRGCRHRRLSAVALRALLQSLYSFPPRALIMRRSWQEVKRLLGNSWQIVLDVHEQRAHDRCMTQYDISTRHCQRHGFVDHGRVIARGQPECLACADERESEGFVTSFPHMWTASDIERYNADYARVIGARS